MLSRRYHEWPAKRTKQKIFDHSGREEGIQVLNYSPRSHSPTGQQVISDLDSTSRTTCPPRRKLHYTGSNEKKHQNKCIEIRILQLDKSQSWNNLPIRYMQDDYWSYEAKFCLYYYLVNESLLTFLFCFYDTRQNTTFFEYIILGVFI